MTSSVTTVEERARYQWYVYAKPWGNIGGSELAGRIAAVGFEGVEIPIRKNTFVTPENIRSVLPRYADEMRVSGMDILGVGGEFEEDVFAACADAGITRVRNMLRLRDADPREEFVRINTLLETAAELGQRYGVTVCVQPHFGEFISTALEVNMLAAPYPTDLMTIAWDAAHEGLAGQDPAKSIGMVRDRVSIVNLKNALYRADLGERGLAHRTAAWFCPADEGLADWSRVFRTLDTYGWSGPICLSAQYSTTPENRSLNELESMVSADLQVARDAAGGMK